ncbi:MAG: nucleoside phosphorylase [Candidatus Kariarchaeaceae archaeon]|jgi:purine-nucleoside phosphorylase
MPFPNFLDKFNEKALITPEKYLNYLKEREIYPDFDPPDGIILCYNRELLRKIIDTHNLIEKKVFMGSFYLLEGQSADQSIGICGNFGIGAPIAAMLVDVWSVFGVKKYISIGTAGSLQEDVKLGSVILCDKAIRDEGSSYHYQKAAKYSFPSKELFTQIKSEMDTMEIDYKIGTSWTTDAPYRETIAEVRKYREEGVITVEMEASAIFSVAEYRNVFAAALLTISDYLNERDWSPQFHQTATSLINLFNIAKSVLTKK